MGSGRAGAAEVHVRRERGGARADTSVGDQVIRENPAQHESVAGAPKNRQRIIFFNDQVINLVPLCMRLSLPVSQSVSTVCMRLPVPRRVKWPASLASRSGCWPERRASPASCAPTPLRMKAPARSADGAGKRSQRANARGPSRAVVCAPAVSTAAL